MPDLAYPRLCMWWGVRWAPGPDVPYLLASGCLGSLLPHCLPTWSAVKGLMVPYRWALHSRISSVVEVPAYCHCSRGELSGGHTRSGTGRSRRVCAASWRPRRPQGCAPQPDSQVRGSLWFRHFPREGRRIFCDPLVHSLGLFICLYCYIYIACPFL